MKSKVTMVILYHKYGCWDMHHYIVIGANKKTKNANWIELTNCNFFFHNFKDVWNSKVSKDFLAQNWLLSLHHFIVYPHSNNTTKPSAKNSVAKIFIKIISKKIIVDVTKCMLVEETPIHTTQYNQTLTSWSLSCVFQELTYWLIELSM